ncbi:hypothetical protein EDD30_6756 [Couchioplanes caeruleus]|uniref:Uncharacterized protein n=2 Tax=Couchioplanes caeruleus TaxID=56438 RepID=A0A1K0GJH2_9ACTN|nr:hypothetical protein BG844_28535 [Couchioplanes caeruleus subsp. caeruleus]ROP33720.1 hypothetical protein EDD30_6756 [Couchioplanes caeruleus]
MAASSTGARQRGGLALLIWLAGPLFELAGVLLIYAGMPDVVEDVGFSSPVTQVMVLAVLVVTVGGALLAWRGVTGTARWVVAAALFVAAGLTAALGLAFITGGILAVFTILMLHSALSIAFVGRAVLRSSASEGR